MNDFNSDLVIDLFKQRDELKRENEALKQRIERLEEAGDTLKASGYFGGFGDAVNKWINVKEAKP